MMWGYGYDHMGYGNGFGEVLSLIFGILIIVFAVVLIKRMIWGGRMHRHGRFCRMCMHEDSGTGAIEILKERYAKGEIKKEEFEQMKKDLLG